jgi:hypothetical protein
VEEPEGVKMSDGPTTHPATQGGLIAGLRRIGRGRLLTLAVAIGLASILGVSIWRLRSVAGIPDVGDPFDVAAARRPIDLPDEDNAYALYAEAKQQLTRLPASLAKVELDSLTWSKSGQAVRTYLEQNRTAIETWRRGSERFDALYHQPGELRIDTLLPVVQDLRVLSRLGGLEGTRLEEEGAMEQAWGWYRAMLRCSRLVGRHGILIERGVGSALHKEAAQRILSWAADPRVDTGLLRRALEDALRADALTPPDSEALKLEYLMYLRDLRELRVLTHEIPLPGGKDGLLEQAATGVGWKAPIQRIWLRASNDDERGRRAARMLFANWLAQIDRPVTRRAPIAVQSPVLVYAPDPTAPPAARALPPERLAKAVDRSALARLIFGDYPFKQTSPTAGVTLWEEGGWLTRERRRRSALIAGLAAELYRREHGPLPATAGDLLGPYLEELPEGIAAGDPIPKVVD